MDHIAIMKKSWGFTQKILSGQKKIESRWYNSKRAPWDRIKTGDMAYFKDSGEPITLKARVKNVIQFSGLTEAEVSNIFRLYGRDIGIEEGNVNSILDRNKNKKYCVLIFLEDVEKIKPFEIDKTGFGLMSAWICVEDIEKIKI